MTQGPSEAPRLDPYHAAYLFRRALEHDPEGAPTDPAASHVMFEALAEDDAMALVAAVRPCLGLEGLYRLAVDRLGRDTRPRVRAAWVDALASRGAPGLGGILRRTLASDPSPRVVATALRALGQACEEVPLEFLRPFLTHADSRVRANAVELLIERDGPGVEGVLEVLLNDPAPRVAANAALALWRRGRRELSRFLAREEPPATRLAFLHAAGRAGRDRRLQELVEQAFQHGAPAERRVAARSLAAVRGPDAVPELMDMALRADDSHLRNPMVEGCLEVAPEVVRRALVGALRVEPAPGRQRYRANALAVLRELEELPDLSLVTPLLEDADPRVRANAVELLEVRPGERSVEPALARALQDPAARVRANAAVALWRRGSPAGLGVLVHELEDSPAAPAAASAAWGLGQMGGTIAEQALETALQRGGGATRRMAYRFLSKAA